MRKLHAAIVVCVVAGAFGLAVPSASASVASPALGHSTAGGKFACIEELQPACALVAKVLCKTPCMVNPAATSDTKLYCERDLYLVCAVLAKTICKPGCAVATATGTRVPVPRMTCEPDAIEIVCFVLGKTLCAKPGSCGLAVGLRTDTRASALQAPRFYCGYLLDRICRIVCPHCAVAGAVATGTSTPARLQSR